MVEIKIVKARLRAHDQRSKTKNGNKSMVLFGLTYDELKNSFLSSIKAFVLILVIRSMLLLINVLFRL